MENENDFSTKQAPEVSQLKEEQEHQSYGQPDIGNTGSDRQEGQSAAGQPESGAQYGAGQAYEQSGAEQAYGQPGAGQQYGAGQAYGQSGAEQTYGQPGAGQQYGAGQSYGQPGFGSQNMAYGMMPTDANGRPLQNRFGMKLTFSILEIISCMPVTIIMGIIACIFTTKANNSYKSGRWEAFKSQAKTSAVCLWIGLGTFVLGFILTVVLVTAGILGSTGSSAYGRVYASVDGVDIPVPCDYETLEELGFSLDRTDRFTTVEAYDFDLFYVRNAEGDYVTWCWFENNTPSDVYATECDIIGINIDYYCQNYETFRTDKGLGFYNTREDYIDAYGQPDDMEEDMYGETLYWYFDNGSDPVWRVMEVTFEEDGTIYQIDVDYR